MANIQPVSVWYKGEQRNANVFTLYSTYDNLLDSANFKYQLIEEIIIPEHQEIVNGVMIIILEQITSQTLIIEEIPINGQDYEEWDSSVSANEWIYNWAANKLGLTITNI
jgi:hypothetical protein